MRKMKTITIKWYLLLSALTLFSFGLLPASVIAETTDTDTHFAVDIIETSNSRSGAEAVSVTVKNIFNQTATNTVAKVVLPEKFAKRLGKATVTENIGTLKAGASRQFLIRLSDGSIKVLPTTSEQIIKIIAVIGFVLLAMAVLLFCKRKFFVLSVLVLGFAGTAIVSAASSYTHEAVHHHQTVVAGEKLAFKTIIGGDFELAAASDSTSSSSSESSASSTDASLPSSPTGNSTSSSSEEEPVTPEEPPTPPVVKYQVSFDLDYETEASAPNAQSVVKGEKAKEPEVPAREGYCFDGWFEAGSEVSFDFSTVITSNRTLYARWTIIEYNISYSLAGGTLDENAPSVYTVLTETIKLGIPTRSGFVFSGWYTDSTFENIETSILKGSTGNRTFYAKWEEPVIIDYKTYDGSNDILIDDVSSIVVAKNSNYEVPDAPELAGQYFLGWSTVVNMGRGEAPNLYVPTDNDYQQSIKSTLNIPDQKYLGGTGDGNSFTVTGNTTLYAVYIKTLPVTEMPSEAAPLKEEFVWNDSVWRVIGVSGVNRLVLKANALTEAEATGLGETTGRYITEFSGKSVYFTTWSYDNATATGYGDSYLKSLIDSYYANYITANASAAVLPIDLNLPIYNEYVGDGFTGYSRDERPMSYINWKWTNKVTGYTDPRFSASLTELSNDDSFHNPSGVNQLKPQAFALSVGDIVANINLIGQYSNLLNFTGSNINAYYLRSPGEDALFVAMVNGGSIGGVWTNFHKWYVRPALWLTLDN
ncbi:MULTISPECIES: InlB B-repeat-containing protein [unclassified Enterococcus]|uniref:InlB B-repeat-containing protein n=1 Tax=unclassified Enterococcus TaxID=2608891 RepID=UPI0015533B7F|nr:MULTISPECIES: InlB B-repeat-containing protein [unclassified Enterococcus]MBS7577603.1 InlB B-repeat-containing protein [Enterococcus sp. MMGLQ5-2]MBS7584898.1 InlB B-repeat-containing protein [Enterococcus sp. MMGLQ5-1]NPD12753.1 LPXTG cell wall anchor domain-containing protein [Enterococcus sp. MMGLQ5-1]NPD37436.1 LPXTG cell wall anchor domain-containing protein [Enterococcus sp. MMGLQ5-2]